MNQKLNYEAQISCYGGAIADFEFYAESAELAKDHLAHILASDNLHGFQWHKIPNQMHYIRYKKKGNTISKYIYTTKPFDPTGYKKYEDLCKKVPGLYPEMLSILERLAAEYPSWEVRANHFEILSKEADQLLNKLNS